MGRIKSGSILIELPLLNYPVFVKLVEYLVEMGIKTVDLLLESTVVDTEIATSTIPVAVTPFSIVVEGLDMETVSRACREGCRFYVVVRDTWAETARVNTELMLRSLRTLLAEPGSYEIFENTRVVLVSGSVCPVPVIIETLAVKYPMVTHVEREVQNLAEVVMKVVKDVRGIPLALCISNGVDLVGLLEMLDSKRTLYIKKPVSNLEYSICVQVLLDFLAYISLKEPDHQNK